MATKQDGLWRGSLTEVVKAPLEKVWELLADFDGAQKNFPELFASCETVEGEKNKEGSLRILVVPLPNGTKLETKQRLLVLDNEKHTVSYTVEDNPVLNDYKVVYTAEKRENDTTQVLFTFENRPHAALTEESFLTQQKGFVQTLLVILGQKLSQ